MTSDAPLISIIVPAYNEAQMITAVIDRLLSVPLPAEREIVIVNDGSTDATAAALARISDPRVTVLNADGNRGKGSAVRLGLVHAHGSVVAIQDADLELDPAQLAALVAPVLAGTSAVVYGSRFLQDAPGVPLVTRLANRALTALTNVLFGASLTDMETCYKVMRRDVALSLELSADRFDIEPQITARLLRRGHRILELPVKFEPRSRAQGKKIGWRDGVRAVRVLVEQRWRD